MQFLSYNSGLGKYLPRFYTKNDLVALNLPGKSVNIILQLQAKEWEGIFLKFDVGYSGIEVFYYSGKKHSSLGLFHLPLSQSLVDILDEIKNKVIEIKRKINKRINLELVAMENIKIPELNVKILIPVTSVAA